MWPMQMQQGIAQIVGEQGITTWTVRSTAKVKVILLLQPIDETSLLLLQQQQAQYYVNAKSLLCC